MIISLRADGTAVMLEPSHVYQGSNIVNVYVIAPFPNTTALQIGFTLPDGTTTSAPMTYVQDSENNLIVWQYTIAAAITNEAGAASLSITASTTTGQTIVSQSIPFTIEATTLPELPDTPSQDEWTLVLLYLQQNSSNIAALQGQISTIEDTANTANTNASAALTAAQNAETTANGYAESIETANQNASAAVETANQAQQDADDLSTEVAQLKDQIVEKQGTAVSVGGDYVANIEFTSDPQTQIDNIISGATTVGKASADGNGKVFADTYLPINNKTLTLNNTNVTATSIYEFVQSFNLKYGESTLQMYFESGSNYSTIRGFLDAAGVVYASYNYLSVLCVGNVYVVTVYAGYNNTSNIKQPQSFFVSSVGSSPVLSTNNCLKVDPSKLTPSTANGWTEGGGSLIPSNAGKFLIYAEFTLAAYPYTGYGEVIYNGTTGNGYISCNAGGNASNQFSVFINSTGTYIGSTITPTTVYYKQE